MLRVPDIMEEDKGIAEAAFPAQASDLPFYAVNPTGDLRRWLNWQYLKNATFVIGLVLPISLALFAFGLTGLFGSVSAAFDVVIGSVSPSFSLWLNTLISREWVMWLFLIGAATDLVYRVFSMSFLRLAEYVASKRPVQLFDAMIMGIRNRIKQKYQKTRSFISALVLISVGGLLSALLSWVVIFASYHNLYGGVFDGVPDSLSLRTAFGAVLEEMVNWLTRGQGPLVVMTPIRDFFDYEGSLTGHGRMLRLLAGLSVPFVIGEQIRRLLRYRHKEV